MHMRTGRLVNPGFGNDLTVVPSASVQDKLTELRDIARPQTKSTRVRGTIVIAYPFDIPNAERLEQGFLREPVDRVCQYLLQDGTKESGQAAVVVVGCSGRTRTRLLKHIAMAIGSDHHAPFAVGWIAVGNVLVPR